MKTATSKFRPAFVLGLIAAMTVTSGVIPVTSAQDASRTVASGSNIPVSPNAPEQYVVKTGDTLWGISKLFLTEPWFWPEIWYVNPQISNPHRIYPGDTLKIVYVEGRPRLTVAQRGGDVIQGEGGSTSRGGNTVRLSPQVRTEPLSRAIATIPYDVLADFSGRPVLLDKKQAKNAPYVVALRDGHLIGGSGNEIYARGLGSAAVDSRYSVIHVDGELRDPDTRDVLGFTGIYVGSGPVLKTGETAKLVLTDSSQEALQGDKLFPESTEVNEDFVPHAPERNIDATVIAVRSMSIMGNYQLIALNRGSKAGLEAGHVLSLEQRGETVRDRYSRGGLDAGDKAFAARGKKVELPSERVGVAIVYKTFDRMSYALIMETTREIKEGDLALNP